MELATVSIETVKRQSATDTEKVMSLAQGQGQAIRTQVVTFIG
jgi:hypothetical protein